MSFSALRTGSETVATYPRGLTRCGGMASFSLVICDVSCEGSAAVS